jgi:hypothetical protein
MCRVFHFANSETRTLFAGVDIRKVQRLVIWLAAKLAYNTY